MQTDTAAPGARRPPGASRFGGGDVNVQELAAELDQLAERIARIKPPSARNPHAFHEDRSEVAHDARSIATWLRTGRKP